VTNEETGLRIDRQVAIAGRLTNADHAPLAGAVVRLAKMPPELREVVGTARALENPGSAVTGPDGMFYFLDLPGGEYTVAGGSSGESSASVVRDDQGRVQMVWVDLLCGAPADDRVAPGGPRSGGDSNS
jgi:hypothetical protein